MANQQDTTQKKSGSGKWVKGLLLAAFTGLAADDYLTHSAANVLADATVNSIGIVVDQQNVIDFQAAQIKALKKENAGECPGIVTRNPRSQDFSA